MKLPVHFASTPVFRPWSGEHLLVIFVTLAVPVAAGLWARRDLSGRRAGWLACIITVVLLAQMVVNLFTVGLETKHRWQDFMPLHLCHLALFACVSACLTRHRLSYEVAYFWGLGGTLQGLITPGLVCGFPSLEFILFFLGHGGIVSCVIFLTIACDLRPRWSSLGRAFACLLAYGAVAGSFNAVFDTNYGFLRAKPIVATLFDYLGPWPWYIASATGLCLVIFFLLYLPWWIADRLRRAQSANAPAG